MDGSDYEYSVKGDGIKENIIVKEKADVYRYPFIIHMDNVTADFDEMKTGDGSGNEDRGNEDRVRFCVLTKIVEVFIN